MDLATFRADVGKMIRDSAGILQSADLDFAIQEAVKRYSRIRPRVVVADLAGDGSYDYDMPAAFDPDLGQLKEVEYPAGEREKRVVDELDWTLYRSPAGLKLRFLAHTPEAGETIRVTFTARHTVDAVSTTVPEPDHDVITLVSSGIACESLASHYSNAGDSTIQADSVDHRSKAGEYATRAKRFMAMADELLPLKQGEVAPAGGMTSFGDSQGWLTHPARG